MSTDVIALRHNKPQHIYMKYLPFPHIVQFQYINKYTIPTNNTIIWRIPTYSCIPSNNTMIFLPIPVFLLITQ